MKIVLSASPVLEVSRHAITSSPMSDPVLHRTVDVNNREQMNTEFKEFMREVKDTGRPAAICFYRARADRSRAFAGFNKMRASGYYANLDKAKGYAETRDGAANSSAEV